MRCQWSGSGHQLVDPFSGRLLAGRHFLRAQAATFAAEGQDGSTQVSHGRGVLLVCGTGPRGQWPSSASRARARPCCRSSQNLWNGRHERSSRAEASLKHRKAPHPPWAIRSRWVGKGGVAEPVDEQFHVPVADPGAQSPNVQSSLDIVRLLGRGPGLQLLGERPPALPGLSGQRRRRGRPCLSLSGIDNLCTLSNRHRPAAIHTVRRTTDAPMRSPCAP